MKKFKISGFDLGMVIAAVVVALIGGGAWWYFSGVLQQAQNEVSDANKEYVKYSSNPKYHVVVSTSNAKTLQANIDLMKTQLLPLIRTEFKSKDNRLSSIDREDPVAWKHDLDDEVRRLNTAAKAKSVTVPANFYFGFSRYLSQSPSDEQTAVLSKQLLGIEQITNILIGAQVKDITALRRTYEEDPRASSVGAPATEGDHLGGYSSSAPDGSYTAYPFEVEFDANSENFRTVLNGLIQSPYIFIVRSLDVKNSVPTSPLTSALDAMAGTPPSSVVDTSPGEVAATTSTRGPQYLFGNNSTLAIKARIDMIEWTGDVSAISDVPGQKGASNQPSKGKGP